MQEVWPRLRDLKPNGVRARPAATIILVDRSGDEPKVLMGRRNPADRFMPNKFVFPGGRVDPADRRMVAAGTLAGPVARRLETIGGVEMARAIAMAAIRETFEETGLILGTREYGPPEFVPAGEWQDFARHGAFPALDSIHFIARATTPPRLPRRYDTIFLAAEASEIIDEIEGAVGPDKELTELVWLPIHEAHEIELPMITSVVLRELEAREEAGFAHELPVPWYRVRYPRGWERIEM